MFEWREMSVDDIDGLLLVADMVHSGLPESREVFTERVKLFPEGCLVLVDLVESDKVCGYSISHPIRHQEPPALNTMLGEIASDADQYYIHDIAVLPEFRGKGLAAECIDKLLAVADRYKTTSLVSVYGTSPFWGRYGFVPEPVGAALLEKLRQYGEDAVYLSRTNSPPAADFKDLE
ncbi:acyl-CoA N-acyltransferase [Rostrohypoxylon terebratum]|nr:acyl-CoA N-acyltransferase [Rostrohypoxylon terebratum]